MRHHFVPEFVQKAWVTASRGNTLQEFRVDIPGIAPRRRAPGSTGFGHNLWALTKDQVGHLKRQDLEELLFKRLDNDAAVVRTKLLNDGLKCLSLKDRRTWVWFLISLRLRQPELIDHLKKDAEATLRAQLQDVPPDYEEMAVEAGLDPLLSLEEWTEQSFPGAIENVGLTFLEGFIKNQEFGEKIACARWWLWDLSKSKHELILSDNPCLFQGALDAPRFVLALPLSPSKAFLVTRGDQTAHRLRQASPNKLTVWCNEASVEQASERVYARDLTPKRFIENRISKVKRLARRRRANS